MASQDTTGPNASLARRTPSSDRTGRARVQSFLPLTHPSRLNTPLSPHSPTPHPATRTTWGSEQNRPAILDGRVASVALTFSPQSIYCWPAVPACVGFAHAVAFPRKAEPARPARSEDGMALLESRRLCGLCIRGFSSPSPLSWPNGAHGAEDVTSTSTWPPARPLFRFRPSARKVYPAHLVPGTVAAKANSISSSLSFLTFSHSPPRFSHMTAAPGSSPMPFIDILLGWARPNWPFSGAFLGKLPLWRKNVRSRLRPAHISLSGEKAPNHHGHSR